MIEFLANWPGAVALRGSLLLYPIVNAAHILGISLLLGPILILDARMLGLARRVELARVGPLLSDAAKIGAVIAIVTGFVLFTVQPGNYLKNPAFLAKMVLLALALLNAAWVNWGRSWRSAMAGNEIAAGLRVQAAASMVLWIAVLLAGRWIGFV